jgi:hypothetical protein
MTNVIFPDSVRQHRALARPSIAPLSPDDLATVAAAINQEHALCDFHAKQTVAHAIKAGDWLLKAKAQVGHGHWGRWVSEQCDCSPCRARVYMGFATWAAANRSRASELEEQPSMRQATLFLIRDRGQPSTALPVDDEQGPILLTDELRAGLATVLRGVDAKRDIFLQATIKQIVLAYNLDEYDEILKLLAQLRAARHCDNNSEPILWMLRAWASTNAPSSTEAAEVAA